MGRSSEAVRQLMRAGDPLVMGEDEIQAISQGAFARRREGVDFTVPDYEDSVDLAGIDPFAIRRPSWLVTVTAVAAAIVAATAVAVALISTSPRSVPAGRPSVSAPASSTPDSQQVPQGQAGAAQRQQCETAVSTALNSMIVAYRWSASRGGTPAEQLQAATDALRRTATTADQRAELTRIWDTQRATLLRSGAAQVTQEIAVLCK